MTEKIRKGIKKVENGHMNRDLRYLQANPVTICLQIVSLYYNVYK